MKHAWGRREMYIGFLCDSQKERDPYKYLDVSRGIGWGGTDWTELAQDSDQWQDLVNVVMNLRFNKMLGNS
jgi:hypothetical protein